METLSSYDRPPVGEVVCGAYFEEMKTFSSVHYGLFWQRIRDDYPSVQELPPLPEAIGGFPFMLPEIVGIPPLRRVLFVDPSGNFLLQLQTKRFMSNWRRLADQDKYPRFSEIHKRFVHGWAHFADFSKTTLSQSPRITHYELTYFNHILGGESPGSKATKYLSFLAFPKSSPVSLPEVAAIQLQFALPGENGNLNVAIAPGIRAKDQKPLLTVELTARGSARADISENEEWFTSAHEFVVRAFDELTSQIAHEEWGLRI